MPTFKLHTKTALLSSMIIVAMLLAALAITSTTIANIERNDDQTLAEIQARDLAQHITDIGSHDPETLSRAANLIKGTRPNILSVRIWELSHGDFIEKASANGRTPAAPIPESTKNARVRGTGPTVAGAMPYRVFASTSENGRPSGAVEIVQRFDSIWT